MSVPRTFTTKKSLYAGLCENLCLVYATAFADVVRQPVWKFAQVVLLVPFLLLLLHDEPELDKQRVDKLEACVHLTVHDVGAAAEDEPAQEDHLHLVVPSVPRN